MSKKTRPQPRAGTYGTPEQARMHKHPSKGVQRPTGAHSASVIQKPSGAVKLPSGTPRVWSRR